MDKNNKKLKLANIEVNEILNPIFFDKNQKLNVKIKNNILKLIEKFKEHIDIKNLHIKDIVFTGSLANYNYNKKSDVDIHILSDIDKINKDKNLLTNFFKEKTNSWSNNYEITIYGFPIQLYVEDYKIAKTKDWRAMYSLLTDKWILEPKKETKKIDFDEIEKKSKEITKKIDDLNQKYDDNKITGRLAIEKIKDIKNIIKNLREKSLYKEHSEYAVGNLIFKTLRNNGYLEKLKKLKEKIYKNTFTLKENVKLIINEEQYEKLKKDLIFHTI